MIGQTLVWMESEIKKHKIKGKTLDIGSLDVNGNPRYLFKNYIGLDIQKGSNVDVVGSAYKLPFPKNSFNNVLCLSVLEHLADIKKVLSEVKRVLKKGGYFFCSMPSINFPEHEYPKDYWRVTDTGMREFIMKGFKILSLNPYKTPANRFHIIDCLGKKL